MLHRFIKVVNSQEKYDNNLARQTSPSEVAIRAIPIIVYHRIDNSGGGQDEFLGDHKGIGSVCL